MNCTHEIYSRYIGCETDSDGVEWCIVGCRSCEATMRFPAQARLARKYAEIRADYQSGMSATEITEKYGYASRGSVVNLLNQLGVDMRPRGKDFYDKRRSAHGETV